MNILRLKFRYGVERRASFILYVTFYLWVLYKRFQLSTVPTHVDLTQFCLYSCNIKTSRLNGFEIPPDAPWNNLSMRISYIMGYLRLSDRIFVFLHKSSSECFFLRPSLEQLGVENGSDRGAVHGMVNCRSSARIRVRSALWFLPWKLQKVSSVWLHHWNAESCGKAFGCAPTQAKIVNCRDQLWPIYTLHFAGVPAEVFAWWRMSLTLRLLRWLACDFLGLCQLSDRILRVLLFLLN